MINDEYMCSLSEEVGAFDSRDVGGGGVDGVDRQGSSSRVWLQDDEAQELPSSPRPACC